MGASGRHREQRQRDRQGRGQRDESRPRAHAAQGVLVTCTRLSVISPRFRLSVWLSFSEPSGSDTSTLTGTSAPLSAAVSGAFPSGSVVVTSQKEPLASGIVPVSVARRLSPTMVGTAFVS